MKVSVIIPCYKFSKYIEQSVLSVLWQKTNFDFEVLVRDDFSQDGTNEILERLQYHHPNLKIFESSENWGGHKNVLFLSSEAKGEYISYLDGDDYFINQNKLQKQVDFLDSNPEYSMHCTGYWRNSNGVYTPNKTNTWLCSPIKDITTDDLFVENYVSFGRMYRNYKDLIKPYMMSLLYLDYPVNYELSLRGKIRGDEWVGGIYREHGQGVLTSLSSEEKKITHNKIRDYLYNRHNQMNNKTITIIDSFVHNKEIEIKLSQFLDILKENNQDTLLVSNTIIKPEVLSKTKYYLYDSNNKLFENDYTNVSNVTLYHLRDDVDIFDVMPGLQRHGLPVLVNLFNSLIFAKSLGYTHFQRLEVDDKLSESSWGYINTVPTLCYDNGKKGLFYFNEDESKKDVSFHYFYCEIDYFLQIIKRITCEQDYVNYLMDKFGNLDFKIAEEYLYQNIIDNDIDSHILRKTGEQQKVDFEGTLWNTETSISNISPKYEGCSTRIYRVYKNIDGVKTQINHLAVVSYNYTDKPKDRIIKTYFNDGTEETFNQVVGGKHSWSYYIPKEGLERIDVYENDRYLYSEYNENVFAHMYIK
jgi:glycosyltransferase involved in cell wall biosynthesis